MNCEQNVVILKIKRRLCRSLFSSNSFILCRLIRLHLFSHKAIKHRNAGKEKLFTHTIRYKTRILVVGFIRRYMETYVRSASRPISQTNTLSSPSVINKKWIDQMLIIKDQYSIFMFDVTRELSKYNPVKGKYLQVLQFICTFAKS